MASIAALVLTFDEELNIGAALQSLSWVDRVLVLDSGSSDNTVAIAQQYPNVVVEVHEWEGFAKQRRWGIESLRNRFDWLLMIDADERVPDSLALELMRRSQDCDLHGVRLRFDLHFGPYVLRHASPSDGLLRFFRPECVEVPDRTVNERLVLDGNQVLGVERFIHDDLRGLEHWLKRQLDYALLEAAYYVDPRELRRLRRLRRGVRRVMPHTAPILVFLAYIAGRGLWRDGIGGVLYSVEKAINEHHVGLLRNALSR